MKKIIELIHHEQNVSYYSMTTDVEFSVSGCKHVFDDTLHKESTKAKKICGSSVIAFCRIAHRRKSASCFKATMHNL